MTLSCGDLIRGDEARDIPTVMVLLRYAFVAVACEDDARRLLKRMYRLWSIFHRYSSDML